MSFRSLTYLFLKKQENPFYPQERLTNDPHLELIFLFQVLEGPTTAPKQNLREILFHYLHPPKKQAYTFLGDEQLWKRGKGKEGKGKRYTQNDTKVKNFNHQNLVSAATNTSVLGKNATK